MESKTNNPLECCLYFTANSLARNITRMGEEEFAVLGMTPSYAFLLTLAITYPGISQKELSEAMNMAPSTVSRFIDALVKRKLLVKEGQGRTLSITATPEGEQLQPEIARVWNNLYERYSAILGKNAGDQLTERCLQASRKLQSE